MLPPVRALTSRVYKGASVCWSARHMLRNKHKPEPPTAWVVTPTGLFVACGTTTALAALSAMAATRIMRPPPPPLFAAASTSRHARQQPTPAGVTPLQQQPPTPVSAVAAPKRTPPDTKAKLGEAEANLYNIQLILLALERAGGLSVHGMKKLAAIVTDASSTVALSGRVVTDQTRGVICAVMGMIQKSVGAEGTKVIDACRGVPRDKEVESRYLHFLTHPNATPTPPQRAYLCPTLAPANTHSVRGGAERTLFYRHISWDLSVLHVRR